MKKTTLLSILVVAVQLAVAVVAEAQPLKKIPRIGYLAADSQAPSRDSFRQGLRDLGYVEGQSIVIEWRHAEGKSEQFAEYVSELVLARRIR
jgi:putative ABC transport system substrate-binding protein